MKKVKKVTIFIISLAVVIGIVSLSLWQVNLYKERRAQKLAEENLANQKTKTPADEWEELIESMTPGPEAPQINEEELEELTKLMTPENVGINEMDQEEYDGLIELMTPNSNAPRTSEGELDELAEPMISEDVEINEAAQEEFNEPVKLRVIGE
ncbi:MAG: hypothetical protein ACOX0C_03325 [Patescibacteria group bacterium]|jgi:hypothetical protein